MKVKAYIKVFSERANIEVDQLNKAYEDKLNTYASVEGDNIQYGQYISQQANQLITKAESYMKEYEDEYISMEHIYVRQWTLIKQQNII